MPDTGFTATVLHEPLGLEEYRELIRSAHDAIVIVDPAGRVVVANAQAETLFGRPAPELVGLPVEELIPERFRERHVAHRDGFVADPRMRPMGAAMELSARRADGTEIPVEISLSPLRTERGTFVSAAIRDVTDRRKLHSMFRGLLESAPDAMVIVEDGGRIVLVNAQTEQLFGYHRDELIGQPVELLVPERFRDRHPAYRGHFTHAPRARPMGAGLDLLGRRKDGTEFPVEISLSPLQTEDGTLVSSAIRDVTDRRHVEAELRRHRERLEELVEERTTALQAINRELEAFSYSVSHDLRAPLRTLDGFSQALIEDYGDQLDEEGHDNLQRIRRASQRMADLLDGLSALSRLTKVELRREMVDVSAMSRELLEELHSFEPDREVEVRIDDGLHVRADPALMRNLLQNLIGNAWKFTLTEGAARIEVVADELDGEPAVTVRDNGAGFDMAYANKLFGAFQRLHAIDEFPGTGLGLATVQRIVHRHGGRVVPQAAVGEGAAFTFTVER